MVSTPQTIIATIELAAPEIVFLDLTPCKPDPLRLSESETPELTRRGWVMPTLGGRETAIKHAVPEAGGPGNPGSSKKTPSSGRPPGD
jgi:hypothetical protein